jgi:putative component of membrane protein insertase Oxa1/YidC/SpoIIIJ protein YidD
MSKLKVSSISYLPVGDSIRLPETQPESTNTPDLGQINGSNSANNPDSNDFIGLDALLQVLQSANASNVVSPPPPESFDFSRSYAHVGESAAQVAATALNQLSQQEAPDIHYPGPFDGMTLSVRFFSRCYSIFFYLIICLRFDSSVALVPQYQLPISNATFPTRRSQPSCSPTTSIDLRFTGHFPSSIGHVLRLAIAHVHRVDCRHLSSLSPCWPSLARLPCSSSQTPMKMYVFFLIFT